MLHDLGIPSESFAFGAGCNEYPQPLGAGLRLLRAGDPEIDQVLVARRHAAVVLPRGRMLPELPDELRREFRLLALLVGRAPGLRLAARREGGETGGLHAARLLEFTDAADVDVAPVRAGPAGREADLVAPAVDAAARSEEHTSELQSQSNF